MQDKITYINELYASQLAALNQWRTDEMRKLDPAYSSDTLKIPPPPEPIISFDWKIKNFGEDKIERVFNEVNAFDFFEYADPIHAYETEFRPRFLDTFILLKKIKCKVNTVDVVWFFSRLKYYSAISSASPLKKTLPQHFLSNEGTVLKPKTIEKCLKRIREEEYRPDPLWVKKIDSIFTS